MSAPGVHSTGPVGRLAPSPTGLLHLGHARTFLIAWWNARKAGGRVLLRLEDLDRERVRPAYVEGVLRDLEWLGLDWDGAPRVQSEDTRALEDACDALVRSGRAYACACTRAEIAALSAPHAGEGEHPYPGTCRGRFASLQEARAHGGRACGLRLVVPSGPVDIDDALHGARSFDVAREAGDFLIRRRDGAFAYQLAVVVDDAASGVTEVVRGDDLLPSAARQALVLEALELPRPRWMHVPLVLDEDGDRLAKRRASVALARLREAGSDPRAVVAWAARSAGLEVAERAYARDCLPAYDARLVPRQPVRLSARDVESLLGARP